MCCKNTCMYFHSIKIKGGEKSCSRSTIQLYSYTVTFTSKGGVANVPVSILAELQAERHTGMQAYILFYFAIFQQKT